MSTRRESRASAAGSLAKRFTWQVAQERLIRGLLLTCALASVVITVGIICVLVSESIATIPGLGGGQPGGSKAFFQVVSLKEFFLETEWTPNHVGEQQHFGIWPLVSATFLVAGIAALFGLPIGILSAVYLSEYSTPGVRSVVKPVLELLAGIPSVVYGYFGLVIVTPYVLRPVFEGLFGLKVDVFNALAGGIVVGIMILPTVCSLSEDALRAVPRSLREAGYALGSTKFDVSARIVLPAAISGIAASFLLAISRAVGETMAVLMIVTGMPALTFNPLRQMQTMTTYIANTSMGETPVGSIEYKSLYAVALCLFCMTLSMNIVSQRIMRRFREVYQ
jgi:phosphate transport system permease protein